MFAIFQDRPALLVSARHEPSVRQDKNNVCLVCLTDDAVVDRIAPASGFMNAKIWPWQLFESQQERRAVGEEPWTLRMSKQTKYERFGMRHLGLRLAFYGRFSAVARVQVLNFNSSRAPTVGAQFI